MSASERQISRICGASAAIIGFAAIAMALANRDTAAHGGRDISLLGPFGAMLAIVGAFAWLQRIVATVIIATVAGALGTWLVIGGAIAGPFPWSLINIGVGIVLQLPLIWLGRLYLARWRSRRGQ